MKRTVTLAALPLALSLTAGAALAQAMTFGGIDTNEDGKLELAELEVAFGANASLAMEQYDMNKDGVVEVDEAVEVSMRGAVGAEPGETTAVEDTAEALMKDGEEAEERQAMAIEDMEDETDS